ncbi:MAG TPA: hypothetical protein DEA08_06380 [Planctomycetes bacterium]|nr:hypothetical protein [Planctomycetota bacterium]|tara:strand:+ start:567 stop:1121 length:555 start_codon:yes stop_codon:yes gene_type:complete
MTEAQPPASPISASSRLELAEKNLERVCQWIVVADQKGAFLLAFAGVVVGTCLLQFSVLQQAFFGTHDGAYKVLVWVALIVALLSTTASSFQIIRMGWPTVTAEGDSLLFFGTIQAKTSETFASEFQAQTEEQVLADLLSQTHINSRIAFTKHRLLSQAFCFMATGLVAWTVLFVALLWAKAPA